MIIRKPYAFLIKNYRKIHIFLLILSLFVAYKLVDVSNYVNEFMRFGSYDMFTNPITKHIDIWLNLSLFFLMVGSAALLFLLYYKKKPWKIYLIPVIEYFVLFFVLLMIKGFFDGYTSSVQTTDLRLSRDLLLIFLVVHLAPIAIFVMRSIGWDIRKFQFDTDQEFLELSEKDREEVEVGLSFDKHSFIRGFKRMLRHVQYFYGEHRGFCRIIIGGILIITIVRIGLFFFVTNRTYSQGDVYSVEGYSFQINHAYFTDKDYRGNIITKKSNFVIVSLTITNHSSDRTIYLENFHLRNGISDFVTTNKIYAKEFQDLGVASDSKTKLKRGASLNCIIVYKVDSDLSKNNFTLYYQEKNGILRKIKLKVKDLSKMEKAVTLKLGEELDVHFQEKEENLRLDYVLVSQNITYTIRRCTSGGCSFIEREFSIDPASNDRILQLDFSSDNYESKDILDFLKNYAKIVYVSEDDEEYALDIKSPIRDIYYGKTVFLVVPSDVLNAKSVSLDLILRNRHYIYDVGEIYE